MRWPPISISTFFTIMCPSQFNHLKALLLATVTAGRDTRRYMRWIRSPLREIVHVTFFPHWISFGFHQKQDFILSLFKTHNHKVSEPFYWLRIIQFLTFLPLGTVINCVLAIWINSNGSKNFRSFPQLGYVAVNSLNLPLDILKCLLQTISRICTTIDLYLCAFTQVGL